MNKQYYSVLPKEARLQLLIEADYLTILELCKDPLFKEICNSDVLWEEKLKRDFNINTNKNAKNKYLREYQGKLVKDIEKKEDEIDNISENIEDRLESLNEEEKEEIKKIKEEYKEKRKKLRGTLNEELGLNEQQKELNKLGKISKQIKIKIQPGNLYVLKDDNTAKSIKADFAKNGRQVGLITISKKLNRYKIEFPDSRDAEEAKEEFKDKYTFL